MAISTLLTLSSVHSAVGSKSSPEPSSRLVGPNEVHKFKCGTDIFGCPIFCKYPSSKPIPLALVHPIFGAFVEKVDSYQPTSLDDTLVNELRESMPKEYKQEAELCQAFATTLLKHYNEIQLEATTVGLMNYTPFFEVMEMEGDSLRVAHDDLLGKLDGDVRVASYGYFVAFGEVNKELAKVFPSILIYYNGENGGSTFHCLGLTIRPGPWIGFAGTVTTDHARFEPLTPMYPLHKNRMALGQLHKHYTQLSSKQLPVKDPKSLTFPYREHYTGDDGTRVDFTYRGRFLIGNILF